MPLLVQQSLLYISGGEVSDEALSKAKYRRPEWEYGEPFYLRQYGGRCLGDQIVVAFKPKDNLFDRRAAITMGIKAMTDHEIRTKLTEDLSANGFVQGDERDDGFTAFSDNKTNIEVSIYLKHDTASISIRKISDC
jgi:hypothetical protein